MGGTLAGTVGRAVWLAGTVTGTVFRTVTADGAWNGLAGTVARRVPGTVTGTVDINVTMDKCEPLALGLVPIVEPDVSLTGDHDLETAVRVNVKAGCCRLTQLDPRLTQG